MIQKTITIETKPTREGQKSRSFSVELLAYLVTNDLWELGAGGKDRVLRPVLMAYAGTDQASRAFSANLRDGRPANARVGSTRFEIPRSAGFRYETSSRAGATLTLAYLPQLFSLPPAAPDLEDISFVCLPPTWWVDEQAQATAEQFGSDAREAAIAAYFVAFLDQRSSLPIANDLHFHLKLYRAAREQPWCRLSSGSEFQPGALFHAGLPVVGFEPAVACKVDPTTFAEFIKAQTAQHLQLSKEPLAHGTPFIHRSRRILPNADRRTAKSGVAGQLHAG